MLPTTLKGEGGTKARLGERQPRPGEGKEVGANEEASVDYTDNALQEEQQEDSSNSRG